MELRRVPFARKGHVMIGGRTESDTGLSDLSSSAARQLPIIPEPGTIMPPEPPVIIPRPMIPDRDASI